ncbi:MAG: lipopolysaccharide heptosyltransferase II [Sedimentisphaerales bacterium]|nr:lipopolysaccharide heptosyltransferase II [Sedimentisphaerales bacterium]MBN2843434.1 lipopolysaccharide heptosyltransferase II [Sedimentisphaerales bacterium]
MKLAEETGKIIVRCPNWVGDIVMATPVFEALRQSYPQAEIMALVRSYACDILDGSPWFDRVVGVDDKSGAGRSAQIAAVREFGAESALVFPNSWSSLLPIWRGGCRKIYGYRRNFRGLLLKGGPYPPRSGMKIKAVPTTDYYAELGRYLGLTLPEVVEPRLYVSEEAEERAGTIYNKYGISASDMVVGLNPGASFGSSKCWPGRYYAELAERLEGEYGCRLFMFTAPGEERIAQEIMGATKAGVIDMRNEGLDLSLLKPLVKRCCLLVTNDTGPRHYAVAFGVPVAVLFGSTDPGLTASNLEKTATIRLDIECSPCQEKVCPLGHHKCMEDMTVDMVYGEVRDLMLRVGIA